MTNRHKVFVSYHHSNDQYYREKFEQICNFYDVMVSKSVNIGDIDPNLNTETIRRRIRDEYLRDSTVTVVLIGRETWKRKHVDWEISSSIRNTDFNPRSGLVGILLPSFVKNFDGTYNGNQIPPRLWDNVNKGFAKVYNWTENSYSLQQYIHEAFLNRKQILPDNSRPLFKNNRSGDYWRNY